MADRLTPHVSADHRERAAMTAQRRTATGARLLALPLPLLLAAPLPAPDAESSPAIVLPLAQPRWSLAAAADLLDAVDRSADHGLDPDDYGADALRLAMRRGRGLALDEAAAATGLALARDYARGRLARPANFGWHIGGDALDDQALAAGLSMAAERGRAAAWIEAQLPRDPRYIALARAYRATPAADDDRRDRLRANLERWRWMPRGLGSSMIWVNVPEYRLRLIRGGALVAEHDVIVGSPRTPTPQIDADARSITINPWWTLPPSVLREAVASAAPIT
jgi:murein L,D-transpeptidase YcbB/YkuD